MPNEFCPRGLMVASDDACRVTAKLLLIFPRPGGTIEGSIQGLGYMIVERM